VPPVEVSPREGVVYSRSTEPVQVKVKPTTLGEFLVSLKYRLKARHHSGENEFNTGCGRG